MLLRQAEDRDVHWIIRELKAFDEFAGLRIFPSYAYAQERLLQLISDPACCFIIACEGDECMGFIVGYISPHLFNPERIICTEIFWWVSSEYRRGRAGLMLLEAFMAFGMSRAHSVIMTLEHRSPVNPETLLKRGFKEFERNYILEA